ncbi:MAG: hypothetical protein AVDCRST_MAG25-2343 [uncultured Rubrobacteraceae bacterium]|uniref:DUF4352 domain-containing protein n=1 Tax=uncultured Rubrobacteraceae bacterium TaxID=349277 RepID=A0A6J4RJ95_9ACTN|nr:MAG: hypothetical protein AVDCRST_MAG25-2343 [uncultured Rubrobacteraceae bacterium]
MASGGRPVYCARCGNIVAGGDNFCGVCGARVPPSAQEGAPNRQMPAPSYAPPRASGGNSRALPLILGLAAVLLVLVGIGAIVGFTLVSGSGTNAPRSSANEPAPAEDPEPARQEENKGAEASQPPTEQELGVGDSIEVEGVEATLNEVRVLPTTDLDRPIQNPDNRFLAADLTFENVSEGAVSVSSLLEFVLKNEEGYSASQTVHTQQREVAEGEIAPGEKASGEIVYEVPPESRGLQLDYKPFARGGTYTWAIGDLQDVAVAPRPREPRPPTPEVTSPTPEATSPAPEPTSSAPPASEAEVAEAAEAYYQAVDREDWAYTYANLDASTRALYAEDEWYLKNQFFADTEGLELATMDVVVEGSSDPEVGVTVYRTFEDGSSIERYTLFVQESGTWKHRFTAEENAIFQPGVPYKDFVASQ